MYVYIHIYIICDIKGIEIMSNTLLFFGILDEKLKTGKSSENGFSCVSILRAILFCLHLFRELLLKGFIGT